MDSPSKPESTGLVEEGADLSDSAAITGRNYEMNCLNKCMRIHRTGSVLPKRKPSKFLEERMSSDKRHELWIMRARWTYLSSFTSSRKGTSGSRGTACIFSRISGVKVSGLAYGMLDHQIVVYRTAFSHVEELGFASTLDDTLLNGLGEGGNVTV